jgi:putative endonuclease
VAFERPGKVASAQAFLPVKLRSYIGVETAQNARKLKRYVKSGSGKAFAKKRFWTVRAKPILPNSTRKDR